VREQKACIAARRPTGEVAITLDRGLDLSRVQSELALVILSAQLEERRIEPNESEARPVLLMNVREVAGQQSEHDAIRPGGRSLPECLVRRECLPDQLLKLRAFLPEPLTNLLLRFPVAEEHRRMIGPVRPDQVMVTGYGQQDRLRAKLVEVLPEAGERPLQR